MASNLSLLADAATRVSESCATSPKRCIDNENLQFSTPEKKKQKTIHDSSIDVFSLDTLTMHCVNVCESEERSGSLCYIKDTNGNMVIRKRFTCLRGPINMGGKECNTCSNRNGHRPCVRPYYIHYTKASLSDGVPLNPYVATVYRSFAPCNPAWKN